MAASEQHPPSDQSPEQHEQPGHYTDITAELSQLQAGFIDSLADYVVSHPQDTTLAFGSLHYVDEKIGRDFSHLDWLSRGDELIADGNLSVILMNHLGEQHFARLGEQDMINGYALSPYIMEVPVIEALPPTAPEDSSLDTHLSNLSVTIELSHAVAVLYNQTTGAHRTELIGEHFRVFLPLIYPTTRIERYAPDNNSV